MENLSWGLPPPAYGFGHYQNRSRFGSNLEIRDTCPASTQQNLLPRRQRSPSLPPISNFHQEHNNNFESPDGSSTKYPSKQNSDQGNNVKYRYEDVEGETSGYASDCLPQSSPEFWANKQNGPNNDNSNNNNNENSSLNHFVDSGVHLPMSAWQLNSSQDRWSKEKINEERPRWGDRGVAAGRLWEPREAGARLPQVSAKGTPSWVERSLNMIDNGDSQILVIDQQSESSKTDMTDYRNMPEHNSERNTYLLGQNTPIEPTIKAEREFRRLKALELQAAIVQQLEERERQKREDREKRIREEREEDERFRKQQELERQRLEEERRVVEEKQKREQRRAEALRLALEKAEQQAKLDKENKKNRRLRESFDAMSINSELDLKSTDRSPRREQNPHAISANGESKLIQNIYIEQTYSPRRKLVQEQINKAYGCQGAPETSIAMSKPQSARYHNKNDNDTNEQIVKKLEMPRQAQPDALNTTYQGSQPGSLLPEASLSLVQIPITSELLAPVSFNHNNAVQMALLVPPNGIYPCVQPISMQALFSTDNSVLQKNSFNMYSQTDTDDASSNKVLTPSKYRKFKDASTQTEPETVSLKNIGIIEEKSKRRTKSNENDNYNSLEQNTSEEKLNSLTAKKDKRHQSEERLANNKDLESRPKWGVNKPPTQYKKQSEKDIFYTQKRKLRLRKRMQEKNYTSHSSDDNRSPSPIPIAVKSSNEKNRMSLSDYHWRKKSEKQDKIPYPKNLVLETTQITPLECDSNGTVHLGDNFSITSKRTYVHKKIEPPSKNTISLSQKFMNDKYGNSKLWQSDKIDTISSSELNSIDNKIRDIHENKHKERIENRKKLNDNINKSRREQSQYYKEHEEQQPIVLDQLRSLRESLKKQQQIWGKFEGVRRSPSPKNEVDIEMA